MKKLLDPRASFKRKGFTLSILLLSLVFTSFASAIYSPNDEVDSRLRTLTPTLTSVAVPTLYDETSDAVPTLYNEEPVACTMDYTPVCGIDKKTYGNKCTAGSVEINYVGECVAFTPTKKQKTTLNETIKKIQVIIEKKGNSYVLDALYKMQEKISIKDNLKHKYYIQKLLTEFDR